MNRMLSAALVVATLASVGGAHAADWDTSKTPTSNEEFRARFNAGVFKATALGILPETKCWPDDDNKGHYCSTGWTRIEKNGAATQLTLVTFSDGSTGNMVCAGNAAMRTCDTQLGKEWVERWNPSTKEWDTTVTNRDAWPDAPPATTQG